MHHPHTIVKAQQKKNRLLNEDKTTQHISADKSSLDGLSASTTEQPESLALEKLNASWPAQTGSSFAHIGMPNTSNSTVCFFLSSSAAVSSSYDEVSILASVSGSTGAPAMAPSLMSRTERMRRTSPVRQPSTTPSSSRERGGRRGGEGGAGVGREDAVVDEGVDGERTETMEMGAE